MKKKFYMCMISAVLFMSICNVVIYISPEHQTIDMTIGEAEAVAEEESSNHGRPLLQATSGDYLCADCSGDDCGAAC